MAKIPRHKVFVSYHHELDEKYRKEFEELFDGPNKIMDSRAVPIGKLETQGVKTARIRQIIREKYLNKASVTVVLLGKETWARRHVDWEIGASIKKSKAKKNRLGLLGIYLPTHPDFGKDTWDETIIPPRLYDNVDCGFAALYDWSEDPQEVAEWIHEAHTNREKIQPNNGRQFFAKNRSGDGWE